MALRFSELTHTKEQEKERIKKILRDDRELLNEILTELRNEKLNKITDGIK